jgi:hypothetical protein
MSSSRIVMILQLLGITGGSLGLLYGILRFTEWLTDLITDRKPSLSDQEAALFDRLQGKGQS